MPDYKSMSNKEIQTTNYFEIQKTLLLESNQISSQEWHKILQQENLKKITRSIMLMGIQILGSFGLVLGGFQPAFGEKINLAKQEFDRNRPAVCGNQKGSEAVIGAFDNPVLGEGANLVVHISTKPNQKKQFNFVNGTDNINSCITINGKTPQFESINSIDKVKVSNKNEFIIDGITVNGTRKKYKIQQNGDEQPRINEIKFSKNK
jgi:hypothetical protein